MKLGQRSKVIRTAVASGAFSLITLSAAHAACTQDDLRGTWALHGIGYDGEIGNTIRCVVKITARGVVRAGTRCIAKTVNSSGAFESDTSTFGSGKSLRVRANCKVTGGLKVLVDNANVTGISNVTVESAQLSKDGEVVTAVARDVFSGEGRIGDNVFPVSSRSVFYLTLNKQ